MDQASPAAGLPARVRRPARSFSASAECVALIKHFEGFEPRKYICAGGMPTIGYGHVIKLHEVHLHRGEIDEATADRLLSADMREKERGLWVLVAAPVAQCEYDALLSLVFNVGLGIKDGKKGDFADSTLLELVNLEAWDAAREQFGRWVYSKGRRLRDLERRRYVEAAMFDGRDWRQANAAWKASFGAAR
jgi:lysozyme